MSDKIEQCSKCGGHFHNAASCHVSSNNSSRNTWFTPAPKQKQDSFGGFFNENHPIVLFSLPSANDIEDVLKVLFKPVEWTFKYFRKKENLKQGLEPDDPINNKYAAYLTAIFFGSLGASCCAQYARAEPLKKEFSSARIVTLDNTCNDLSFKKDKFVPQTFINEINFIDKNI